MLVAQKVAAEARRPFEQSQKISPGLQASHPRHDSVGPQPTHHAAKNPDELSAEEQVYNPKDVGDVGATVDPDPDAGNDGNMPDNFRPPPLRPSVSFNSRQARLTLKMAANKIGESRVGVCVCVCVCARVTGWCVTEG